MSNAMKGLLLSAFIFPGAGQIILKRYLRGIVFFGVSFTTMIGCVVAVVRQALVLLQDLVTQGADITVRTVLSLTVRASTGDSTLLFQVFVFGFFCCWLLAVVDGYQIGRKQDEQSKTAENSDGFDSSRETKDK